MKLSQAVCVVVLLGWLVGPEIVTGTTTAVVGHDPAVLLNTLIVLDPTTKPEGILNDPPADKVTGVEGPPLTVYDAFKLLGTGFIVMVAEPLLPPKQVTAPKLLAAPEVKQTSVKGFKVIKYGLGNTKVPAVADPKPDGFGLPLQYTFTKTLVKPPCTAN